MITANVSTREVPYGASTVTTFTVKASGKAYAAQSVSVCVSESAGPFACTDTKTTTAGMVAVSRKATKAYQVYLKVPGTATVNEVSSAKVTYKVKVTATVARARKGAMTVTLNGHARQNVQVQQYVSGTWRKVGTYTATTAKTTVNGLAAGKKYRVVVPGTTSLLGVTSASITA